MVNPSAKEILHRYWGYDDFRPLQEEIIHSILEGKDTLALLPTGGGKSICFQVPALLMNGICIVISPLIALMKDQVDNLKRRNIPALLIHTGMNFREITETLQKAISGEYKFLYCSPERLQSRLFKEFLPAMDISFVAVDEAHCISQWGFDFRPAYRNISSIRDEKHKINFLALTASATPEVQSDIRKQLLFTGENVFTKSFSRPNLSYSVLETNSKISKLLEIIKKLEGTGIVYCKSRRRTQEIAETLKSEMINADHYHAGLDQETRNERQQAWIKGDIRIIVCTNAFGMGIDKPDVRFVIHMDCPDSLEHYYQEAGRGGRDGKKSYAVMLYSKLDIEELKSLPDTRYPSMETIRKIYQSLGDYLQIASGTGEDSYYDFDLPEFIKRFKLDLNETLYSLKALQQENILEVNEEVYVPSKLQFTTDRNALEYHESQYPDQEPVIKTLLRSYGGIFDYPCMISEKQIAKICKMRLTDIQLILHKLHAAGIVSYIPKKEKPQVKYLQNRIKTQDLHIDHEQYLKRKKSYSKRISAMTSFVENHRICRNVQICEYFGDRTASSCGICDICVALKKNNRPKIDNKLFVSISSLISKPLVPQELINHFPVAEKDSVIRIIEYMIQENLIKTDEIGRIVLINKQL
ncbi:MAG: RecQ family ATP-dependent DNA helicase [Chitinophagaceae bacterium]